MEDAANRHCTKQPIYEELDEQPTLEANKNDNVISMPGNRFMQSSTKPPKVMPRKPKSEDKRSRKYLTTDEAKRLRAAAKKVGRLGERDSLIVLLMYKHGLRVSELCDLKWEQLQLDNGVIHVNRLKNGSPSVQPLTGEETRALRKWKREQQANPYVFTSERKGPLASRTVQTMIERAGKLAGIEFPVNAHALRHSTGYALANAGLIHALSKPISGIRISNTQSFIHN